MAVELLIMAHDASNHDKGDIVVVKESPTVWGSKDALPHFIRVTIPDATLEQAQNYLYPWKEVLDYEVINSNANGWRVQLFFDRALVSVSGANSLTRERVEDYLQSNYGISIKSVDDNGIVVDVPIAVDLQELKLDLKDKIEKVFKPRRYYFDAADVDLAIAAGGIVTQTREQLVSKIRDKVAE